MRGGSKRPFAIPAPACQRCHAGCARHPQHNRKAEQHDKPVAHPFHAAKQIAIGIGLAPFRTLQHGHCGLSADPGERRDRHQIIAARAQPADNARQRGERLRAVPARIVQQDNLMRLCGRPRRHSGDGARDNRVAARRAPVERIDVEADRQIAHARRHAGSVQLVALVRVGVPQKGRAEQTQRAPGIGLDQPFGGGQFQPDRGGRALAQVGVRG